LKKDKNTTRLGKSQSGGSLKRTSLLFQLSSEEIDGILERTLGKEYCAFCKIKLSWTSAKSLGSNTKKKLCRKCWGKKYG